MSAMNRRDAVKSLTAAAAAVATAKLSGTALAETPPAAFTLPPLGYGYDALEPHIDTATMKVHHAGHHQAYVTVLNGLIEKVPSLKTAEVERILYDLAVIPEDHRTAVRNNLGGHFNHTFFWNLMTPGGAKEPGGDLKAAIEAAFGSKDKLVEDINEAAKKRFGSGWAWLAVDKDKKLAVFSTANQDTTHMDKASRPVIGVDVWEHAYYLKHMNKRADYLNAWWNVVNWDKAAENFRKATA
jgi:Fe-Mn family superoxide dismutase